MKRSILDDLLRFVAARRHRANVRAAGYPRARVTRAGSAALIATVASLGFAPALAAEWTGTARVIDGRTVEIGGTRLRLTGLDAPDVAQICQGPDRQAHDCGREATQELIRLIGDQPVRCGGTGTDRLGLPLVACRAGPADLNAEMVRSGWAITWQSRDYQRLEDEARAARRGVWQGKFQRPEDWRRQHATDSPAAPAKR